MTTATRALRAYADADLPALIDLWVAAWKETGFAINFEARRGWIKDRLHAIRQAGGAILVGLGAQEDVAGFVTLDLQSGYLDQLCVAPKERGSGLATALLSEAKRLSPGAVEVDANEANDRARAFYEREGFSIVGRGMSEQSGLPTTRMRWTRPSTSLRPVESGKTSTTAIGDIA